MALKGTLKDFGIAEILQLIGQQQKTGTLNVRAKGQEVHVGFKEGAIVKAETTTRKKQDLLGAMLVRAAVITEDQLRDALEMQKRTNAKLGAVLVQSRALTEARLKELVKLQATETIFKLFHWKAGTYEFIQGDVVYDPEAMTPLRAEGVLMDGFRMVDEWPVIKKKLPSFQTTFDRVKPLPVEEPKEDDVDAAFDEFAEEKKSENKGEFQSIGSNERKVYALITPGMDVQMLIDRACLGEFETCKALVNLLNLGYAKAVTSPNAPKVKVKVQGPPLMERLRDFVGRVLVPAAVLAGLGYLGSTLPIRPVDALNSPTRFLDPAAQRFVGTQQLSRLEAAVDVYRLERGELPKTLDSLVEAGLLSATDLSYPWKERYHYRPLPTGQFVLLPPLR